MYRIETKGHMTVKHFISLMFAAFCATALAARDFSGIFLGACPSVSADGSRFVFEWNDSIWVASTSGGTARCLTPAETQESRPMISPDGKRVYFVSNRDGGGKLFALDMETSSVRQITRHSELTVPYSVAPDRESIVCVVLRDAGRVETAYRAALVTPDGSERILMENVNAFEPVVSPDGSRLAFTWREDSIYRKRRHGRSSKDREIWIYDFVTGTYSKLPTAAYSAFSARWRPDGRALYYLGRAEGESVASVREYSFETGKDRKVVSFGDDAAFQPTLSVDGKTMVVRAGFDFWRLDPTQENPLPRVIPLKPDSYPPRLSGTYRRFYDRAWNGDGYGDMNFTSEGREVAFTCGGALYVMDTVVRNPRLVAEESVAWIRECYFTPDARRLYYLVNRGDGSAICYAEREDGSLPWWENTAFRKTKLVDDDTVRSGLTVSPDGTRLAWADALGTYTFCGIDGGDVAYGPKATGAGGYSWSPDSKYIATELIDANGNSDVWILATDGAREPFNLSRNCRWDGTPAWSPDGKIIAWSGDRIGSDLHEISYVYLDPADEVADKQGDITRSRRQICPVDAADGAPADGVRYNIDFDTLQSRIRRTGIKGVLPFFSHDSRTLAYNSGSQTDCVTIPSSMTPRKLSSNTGTFPKWFASNDCLTWSVDGRPAHLDNIFHFKVYREDNLADFRLLAFRIAWGRLRDRFYDTRFRGLDWKAVERKYEDAARNASSYSVFQRVMNMMLGEMDASHTGFYKSADVEKEWIRNPPVHRWEKVTCHLGLVFEPGTFKVARVIEGSPAENIVFPGETVLSIDGAPLVPGQTRIEDLLESVAGHVFQLAVEGRGEPVHVKGSTYSSIRGLVAAEKERGRRKRVHEATGGRIGYVAVSQMDVANYNKFEEEIFSEAWGKDALVIDLRGNLGGFTGDRLLSIVCGPDHSFARSPNGLTGYLFSYWTKPIFSKPICVIVDERTQSNGEIFTHAIKTLGRGKVVGRQTAGEVIATYEKKILDFGILREPFWGWFLPDGTDMDMQGAVPDVEVDFTPADAAAGRDVQLDAAIDILLKETAAGSAACG